MACVTSILNSQLQRSIIRQYLQSDDFEVLCTKEECHLDDASGSFEFKVFFNGSQHKAKVLVKSINDGKAKEMVWYKYVFCHPAFNSEFTSKFYFINEDRLVVLEDLSEKGFVQPKIYDFEHVKVSLKTLAKYHACSISLEEEESKKLSQKYKLTEKHPELERTDFELMDGLESIQKVIDHRPKADLEQAEFNSKLSNLVKELQEKKWCNFRSVLCHGLLWNSNVLFRYESDVPVECKIVNFDSQHYSPPGFDVLQLIYLNTDQEFRKHHLHKLLRFYYDSLEHELSQKKINIEKVLPLLEDFEISVHQILPYIKLQTLYLHLKKYEAHKENTAIEESLLELEDFVTQPRITMEDCFKIVESKLKTTDYKLLSHQVLSLDNVIGYVGDHTNLKIEVLVEGKKKSLNFFTKFMPTSAMGIAIATDAKAFIREPFMYQHYFSMLQSLGVDIIKDCTTSCHFSRCNDVVVFNDLKVSNHSNLAFSDYSNYETVKVVVESIAKFHACSIILEERLSEKSEFPWRFNEKFPLPVEATIYSTKENHCCRIWALVGIKAIEFELDLFPDPNPTMSDDELKPKIKKACDQAFELTKPSKEFRNVVCHGDLWSTNILLKTINGKPEDCRFVDFQICRYCPPAHDLLSFLHFTTTREFRQQHFDNLIQFYHSKLAENLEKYGCNIEEIYPYETFLKSVEYLIPHAVVQTVLYSPFIYVSSEVVKAQASDDEAWHKSSFEDRRNYIEYAAKHDTFFATRTAELIQDLREMCMKYY